MFTIEQLDALQAAAEAATAGPWEWEPPSEESWPSYDESLVTTWKGTDGFAEPVVSGWGFDACGTEASDEDRAFIAAANPAVILEFIAEYRRIHAELERSKRGGKTLGEMIKQQCDDIVKITDSAHLIDETGDGDWGAVWERGFDLRAERDTALSRIARVEALHQRDDQWLHLCATCDHEYPCPTVRALTEGERSE